MCKGFTATKSKLDFMKEKIFEYKKFGDLDSGRELLNKLHEELCKRY